MKLYEGWERPTVFDNDPEKHAHLTVFSQKTWIRELERTLNVGHMADAMWVLELVSAMRRLGRE